MKAIAAVACATVAAFTFTTSAQAAPAPHAAVQVRADGAGICDSAGLDQALKDSKPGQLLADPEDVTAASGLATGRLYRIAYATTGEAGTTVASCGLIAVPDAKSINGVIAWAHGTVGLKSICQPSQNPATFVGPMPSGIGAPSKNVQQSDGALYNMLKDGYAVVATDYPSLGMVGGGLQKYVLGVTAGMAVIDSARVLTGSAAKFGLSPIAGNAQMPLVTWGHSQGGGSALWAGQLAPKYLSAKGDQSLNLAGVAAEAPATQFTTSPGQPDAYMGNHLGDRDMYNMDPGIKIGPFPVKFPIGVALFSYVTASWSTISNGLAGEFPVGPTTKVNYASVLTPSGRLTAPVVADLCLNKKGAPSILAAAAPYLKPDKVRFFAKPFGGSPDASGAWQGGIDTTCASPGGQPQAIQDWCAWLQFNMPGPYGVNPYPKRPRANDGTKVPMYLAQGTNDRIIWCVDNQGAVQGANCLTDQYFHSLKDSYCDGTGHLQVDYFPGDSHFDVPGSAATNPTNGSYNGSPLDTFVRGAMKGTLTPMCSVDPDATS